MMPGPLVCLLGLGAAVLLPPLVWRWCRGDGRLRRKVLLGAGSFMAVALALMVEDFWRCWSWLRNDPFFPAEARRRELWDILLSYQRSCWEIAVQVLTPLLAAATGA